MCSSPCLGNSDNRDAIYKELRSGSELYEITSDENQPEGQRDT